MHIAVMDDNIADRKQLERLLDRESDRRIQTTGNLYIDSFGALESLFIAPKQYDFFMVDIIITTYNSINTLDRTLSSILTQIKAPKMTVHIIDDNSCEDYDDIIIYGGHFQS